MSDQYVNPPIETDASVLAEESFEHLGERVPGWEPNPTALDTMVIEETAALAAEVRDVAADVPRAIFRYYGTSLVNLPPGEEAHATVSSTWTAPDDTGYTVEQGWTVGIRVAGDELVLFEVASSVVIPPGSTTTADGEVDLVALDAGAAANGLGGDGAPAELVEGGDVEFTIVLTGLSVDGEDEEDEDVYLGRLAEELQLMTPRPILPRDFAILAKRVAPVDRALAIDLYKPADMPNPGDPEDTNRERSVTVAVVDAAGEPVPAGAKASVDALLQSMRELNFEVWVVDPTYTTIGVRWAGVALPGWDPTDVRDRGNAALAEYLSPATFGTTHLSDERVWNHETHIRYLEVAEVLNRVEGLWRLDPAAAPAGQPEDDTGLALGIEGGALTPADVPLTGVAPLPRAGTIFGTVVLP